ncbi:hypothetical protein BJF90_30000 [Pseudonocardia sp. CNS-004]|nr:hypothetical protein BJF90_30000 [Pseudonocardia sp. CNS-004]
MFEPVSEVGADESVDPRLQDAIDWASLEHELRTGTEDRTWGNTSPSGFFALEIDADTSVESGLSDEQLIDAVVGFERLTGWAQARQARLLAEFARRRPGDDPTLVATDKACTISTFAPDEVGLALKQARMTAKARLGRSVQLDQVLPETLALWERAASTNAGWSRSATPPTTSRWRRRVRCSNVSWTGPPTRPSANSRPR